MDTRSTLLASSGGFPSQRTSAVSCINFFIVSLAKLYKMSEILSDLGNLSADMTLPRYC